MKYIESYSYNIFEESILEIKKQTKINIYVSIEIIY